MVGAFSNYYARHVLCKLLYYFSLNTKKIYIALKTLACRRNFLWKSKFCKSIGYIISTEFFINFNEHFFA